MRNPNIEIRNNLEARNSNGAKIYDLEARTLKFAKEVRSFVSQLSKTVVNTEDGRQLVSSSGSIGANYIEANEALSKKDFLLRIRIARKEAKESRYWLNILAASNPSDNRVRGLIQESTELMMILGSILRKSENV